MSSASAAVKPANPDPAVFTLQQAAAYLGLSYWSVRDYVIQGLIPVTSYPALAPREGERPRKTLRAVRVSRQALDIFIESRQGRYDTVELR